jgi:ATP/maltotriose-dependent transcriptional regulator MalT
LLTNSEPRNAVPHVWYQIAEGDKNPASFFHYVLALRKLIGNSLQEHVRGALYVVGAG